MYSIYKYSFLCSLLEKLKTNQTLVHSDFQKLLEGTYQILQRNHEDKEKYNFALSAICHVSEYLPDDALLQELLLECVSSSRVFLYRDMLRTKSAFIADAEIPLVEAFAKDFYTLNTETTLTRDQKRLFDTFQKNKKIVVSAPTSFGKSRIITEIINHNQYANILIVLPTIALLTETFIRFRQDKGISKRYNIVNSLKQPLENSNVLIFTPEKTDLFLDENPKFKIDFFVMDEIYKIQDDGDRSKVFTSALYRLSKTQADFYLIGPYFDHFSQEFLKRTGSIFVKFNSEIVQKDIIKLTEFEHKEEVRIGNIIIKKGKGADTNLNNILKGSKDQALVYVGNKRGVESKANLIAGKVNDPLEKTELVKYLETTFSKDWSLVFCLNRGIAFHHAGIPKFIQTEIVDAFNSGEIDVIVCSPTLIEGVNTSAKQVIIYDNLKGHPDLPLTDFDVKNINGRAGRFLKHFIGRSIALVSLPENSEQKRIDFSFYDKELDEDEVIQVNKEDLQKSNLIKRNELEKKLSDLNIPLEEIKKNKFIPVENQLKFINILRSTPDFYEGFQFQGNPTKEQFTVIMNMINEYLFVDKYKNNRSFLISRLIFLAKGYVYADLSLKQLIDEQSGKSIDTKIRSALKLVNEYFEFALPKYLTVFQNLFNFVCEELNRADKKISLEWLIMKLEYGVTQPHEIALKEAGLPIIIIKNVSNSFKDCTTINEIRDKYFKNKSIINKLHAYERKIFDKYI
jgi:helicase